MTDQFTSALIGRLVPKIKRKAFFSFNFEDIMRVNVVRNAWKIGHPHSELIRSFYDSSLWERKQIDGDVAVKRLIREGVEYTSAVCVLVGSKTWSRRWVRYEIARAIIDERGLLAVHLNNIRHHQTQVVHELEYNPLTVMGVGKEQANFLTPARYYLFEYLPSWNPFTGWTWVWERYKDYSDPVKLPPWLSDCQANSVTPLSSNASIYDYVGEDGHKNIGGWIDRAAQAAGR